MLFIKSDKAIMKSTSKKVKTRPSFLRKNFTIPRKKGKIGLLRQNSSTPPLGNVPYSAKDAEQDRQPTASDHGIPLIEFERGLFSRIIERKLKIGKITMR
jgi:hypothetical protein